MQMDAGRARHKSGPTTDARDLDKERTKHSGGTPTDASAAHLLLLPAMRSNDDIDWPVNFLMLSFHDLRGPPL